MAGNDPKVRALYVDLYRAFGVEAAWKRRRARVFEDPTLPGGGSRRAPSPVPSAEARAKLARVTGNAPEVMVKVTSRTRDSGHLKAHMEYITRNGKVAAETEYGRMQGKEAINDLHADWSDDEVIYKGQHNVRKAPLSVNMVLSMPSGIDRERFRNAVRDFVEAEIRPRADVMVAFHDDTMHPHAHVTVRGRQRNGRAFNPGKVVLDQYRDRFASALRARGIEAEATPRFARGRVRKADRQHMRHMRARGVFPYRERSTINEVFDELESGRRGSRGRRQEPARERPWEMAARIRHDGVKAVYLATAKALARSGDKADRQLARQTALFASLMPNPEFKRDVYRRAVIERAEEHNRAKERERNAERERNQERDRTRDGPDRER